MCIFVEKMQTYTSKATSINQKKLPAVYGKAILSAPLVMDYGCGKFTDHIKEHVNRQHRTYLPFDPYNQPDDRNAATATIVCHAMSRHLPVDVICSNVLNVIDDLDTIQEIADHIETIATISGGTGYVTVYEGNRSGIGKQTGPDQYQRNEPLRAYLKYFSNATIKNGMIVVSAKSC